MRRKTASGAWSPAANSVSARWKARRLFACLKCWRGCTRAYPQIALELVIGTSRSLYEDMLENRLDAAFVVDMPEDDRLERMDAFAEELVVIAPEGHAPICCPDDIGRKTVLAFQGGCAYRNRLVNWFRALAASRNA